MKQAKDMMASGEFSKMCALQDEQFAAEREIRAIKERAEAVNMGPPELMFNAREPTKRLLGRLQMWGHKVWGFKVYRLTYRGDAKWRMLLEKLNAEARYNLTEARGGPPAGPILLNMVDWAIEDDREKWDGATFEKVRE